MSTPAPERGRARCRYQGCAEPDPPWPVLRKCPAGHRAAAWYCAAHGPVMMAAAERAERRGDTGPACPQCAPARVPMTLVPRGAT